MAEHSLLNTTSPVFLRELPELRLGKEEFQARIRTLVLGYGRQTTLPVHGKDTYASKAASTSQDKQEAPFMTGLLSDKTMIPCLDTQDGKMLTENGDVAYRTSGEALVDLFHELEDAISAEQMSRVLENAWRDDADATLKIIWNARSIHLGKSSRNVFYRALGWLAQNHPLTLITNLPWLVRPIIQKKIPKVDELTGEQIAEDVELIDAKEADSDFEMIDGEDDEPQRKKVKIEDDAELSAFDIKYGVAHGYWKDLLNILALAANDELKVDGNPRSVLNVGKPSGKKRYERDWTEGRKKITNSKRHERVVEKLEKDSFHGFYKALHLTVARLFADQLRLDLARFQSGTKADRKLISLAAKWAPTHKGMHDQHTCIVSTIAELLFPFDSACPENVDSTNRELYLKYARIAYQSKILSPLRRHIDIVERKITEEKFDEIKYDRIPSLAMKQYTTLFAEKDYERFDQYLDKVASGKAQISGAVLLPSTLVCAVSGTQLPATTTKAKVEQKIRNIQFKSIDGQWRTLVQRIKDSGTLSDSIAVCDVSGSMSGPTFADGTTPMHSSIGLSLLIAEVTRPPFGGAFITFSDNPEVLQCGGIGDTRTFQEKVSYIARSDWGGSTNFVAVFEDLILPMAVKNNLKQEDMVKQIFVFSDMQFNLAGGNQRWTSSFERIQKKYEDAGYEMPKLIFWNLAGGRAGVTGRGDITAPKPITAAEENTALVSGYSQGQMKMFLENGGFDEPEEEVVEVKTEEKKEEKKQKEKMDPLVVVKKAIGHMAYRPLKVVD